MSRDSKDVLSFLEPAQLSENRLWGDLAPETEAELIAAAGRIAGDAALQQRMETAWQQLYVEGGEFACEDGLESLLIALASVPQIRAVHQARGVPEEITQATCQDIRIGAHRYRVLSGGQLGLERRLLSWFRLHATGELYRLGRLQYVLGPFRGRIEAYRHVQTGETLALAGDGVRFDREGYIDRVDGDGNVEHGWTARLVTGEESVTGSPVSPHGMALRQEVTLALNTWRRVLAPGDTVLQMHIPEGEPMTPERCAASLQQAMEFFPKTYPERPFCAFACNSWLLNTQLETMLPPGSNLVAFQREPYLFPIPSNGKDGLYFIFYRNEVDVATAPRDTTLKRAYLDHLAAGKRLRSGGMFLLKEDLARYGTQPYRSQWPTLARLLESVPERLEKEEICDAE